VEGITDGSAQTGGRLVSEAEDIIAAGHPPIAEGIVLVDFDGTVAPFGYLFDFPEPKRRAIESMRRLKARGLKIVIFTSRLSPLWLESVGQTSAQHIRYISEYLGRYGIEPDGFTAQKIPSIAIIDDKAYRYDDNWDEVADAIIASIDRL